MFKHFETIIISLFKEILDNISKNWGMFFTAVTVVSFSFFVLQFIILIYYNMENFKQKMISQITVHVYLKEDVKSQKVSDFIYKLEKDEKVLSTTLVSKNELLNRIKNELNVQYANLPMGDIVYIKLKDPEFIDSFASKLKKEEIVKDVMYWQEYAKNINNFFGILKKILFGIIIFLSVGVILIINNTVKMSILSRKNEIKIMNLVGATGWFIKSPLFFEIFIVLLVSSLISHYFLRIGYGYIYNKFNSEIVFFSLIPVDYLIFIRNTIFLISVIVSVFFVSVTIERYLKKLAEDE
ncbi:MAG: cell division protein FtsX [bacterium]